MWCRWGRSCACGWCVWCLNRCMVCRLRDIASQERVCGHQFPCVLARIGQGDLDVVSTPLWSGLTPKLCA